MSTYKPIRIRRGTYANLPGGGTMLGELRYATDIKRLFIDDGTDNVPLSFNWQGAYAAGTAYLPNDLVYYSDNVYICILASTGNLPTDTTYWSLFLDWSTFTGSYISDTAYAASWDGVTTIAPSKNAVYDEMELRAPKASPTFTGIPLAPTAAAGTNTTQIATTAYAYALVSDTVYGAGWDTITGIAPSKNAVYDRMVLLAPLASPSFTGTVTLEDSIVATDTMSVVGSVYDATKLISTGWSAVKGNYAYVCGSGSNTLVIYDITNKTAPVEVGYLTDNTNLDMAENIIVIGNYAYIAAYDANRLTIVDVSDPTTPTVVGSKQDNTYLKNIVYLRVIGKYAFTAGKAYDSTDTFYFCSWDISDPTNITMVDSISSQYYNATSGIFYNGGKYIYLAYNDFVGNVVTNLSTINISDPTNLVGSTVDMPGIDFYPASFAIKGDFLFLHNGSTTIYTINISDPATPAIVATTPVSGALSSFFVTVLAGNYLYVTTNNNNGISIIDISNPLVPVYASSIQDAVSLYGADDIRILGQYAYIAVNGGKRFTIVKLPGFTAATASIGNIHTSDIIVDNNIVVQGDVQVGGGLNVDSFGMVNGDFHVQGKATFGVSPTPNVNNGVALGTTALQFSDLFLAEGGVINWDNGDATLTQVGDVVTLAGADLKVTNPGNADTSVVTTDGTQTLTNKTIAAYLLVADIDDTPVNNETAQPISSNWAYDHNAATPSATVHYSSSLARYFPGADITNIPSSVVARINLDTVSYDLGSNFTNADWYGTSTTYRQADADSDAGHIEDDDAVFSFDTTLTIGNSLVYWRDTPTTAGMTKSGTGYVTGVSDIDTIHITKATGDDFAASYYYYIKKSFYVVPTTGYYDVRGIVRFSSTEDGKRYRMEVRAGSTTLMANSKHASGTTTLHVEQSDIIYLTAGQNVYLSAYAESIAGTATVTGHATLPYYTTLTIKLYQGA